MSIKKRKKKGKVGNPVYMYLSVARSCGRKCDKAVFRTLQGVNVRLLVDVSPIASNIIKTSGCVVCTHERGYINP